MIVELRKRVAKYPELSPRQPYVVIGIEADSFRILNDQGIPYLYPPSLFRMIDPRPSPDWVEETGDGDERYAYPAALNAPGFFEDYFDGKPKARAMFWHVVNRRLGRAM